MIPVLDVARYRNFWSIVHIQILSLSFAAQAAIKEM